jgi:hypothetical protein
MADEQEAKQRKRRNLAIAAMLFVFIAVVYAVTILRISQNVDAQ